MNKIATAPSTATYACQVLGVTPLSAETFQIELQSPPGTILRYRAGQYLQLELDINGDGQPLSLFYSIANSFSSEQPRRLQLFIQNGSELADKILKHLSQLKKNVANVQVKLPMGRAFLQTDLSLPHLLIAAGSGISKIKCLSEEILKQHPEANVQIYWSNKKVDDFYLLEEFLEKEGKHKNLNFTPIVESDNNDWFGRSGYIYKVIEEDFENLKDTQAYLCGSPQMVYGTIDKLQTRYLKEKNCYSDVFEYAPRNPKIAI